jgi:hypothetical protein
LQQDYSATFLRPELTAGRVPAGLKNKCQLNSKKT